MKASLELIRQIAHGVVNVEENDGEILLHRFTEAQRAVYEYNPDFYVKTFATSGVRLEFITDADSVSISGTAALASSRIFYALDVVVNNIHIIHHAHESVIDEPEFSFAIPLDGRHNKVAIYLPNLAKITLRSLEFNGGKEVIPVKKERRILCFGDSITQGYDTRFPIFAYPNLIADSLNAEMINKGIGGDFFNPQLADIPDEITPDLITVAYGTNDWAKNPKKVFEDDCAGFFDALSRRYPGVKICALLPIWRQNMDRITDVGTFAQAAEIIRKNCEKHPEITVVNGLELVPHLPEFFSPDVLHPNDFGFQCYARNLLERLPEF